MSDIAIHCEGLGKQYRIGQRESFKTLRDTIANTLSSPFGRLRSAFNGTRTQGENGRDDSFWALSDVSFEIKRGEVVGVIGRNGAGKSTLLKILSRITQPTSGEVLINGRIASLLEVGTGFHPELTGRENIFLNGAILGMKRVEIRRKFDEIVAFAEIEKFIDTPVKRYSSGMYVRLAFAVAAHLEPEILLVDEVLAVGDAQFQKKCLGKMNAVAGEGRTVLVVSHQLQTIRNLCSRTLWLEGGRLVKSGPSGEVLASYLDDRNSTTTTEWSAGEGEQDQKGLPFFTLSRFAVVDEFGEALPAQIDASTSAYIQIEGQLLLGDARLCLGFHLFDQYDSSILMSFQTDVSEDEWPRLTPGAFRLRTRLDLGTLNEGRYRVCLISGLHCVQWFHSSEQLDIGLTFEIPGKPRESPYYMGRRNAVLAPSLRWELI